MSVAPAPPVPEEMDRLEPPKMLANLTFAGAVLVQEGYVGPEPALRCGVQRLFRGVIGAERRNILLGLVVHTVVSTSSPLGFAHRHVNIQDAHQEDCISVIVGVARC